MGLAHEFLSQTEGLEQFNGTAGDAICLASADRGRHLHGRDGRRERHAGAVRASVAATTETGLDQRTLAGRIGLDTSTIGAVVDRLERREPIERKVSPDDKRVRLLSVTPAGKKLLQSVMPAMLRAQGRMLAPLPKADREKFMAMVKRIVEENNAWSRAAKDAG